MVTWRAPGRINLIGEHTDYNDGFVLPFALAVGCTAKVRPADRGWRVTSAQQQDPVTVEPSGLAAAGEVPEWARYVLGACWLLTDRGVRVPPLAVEVDSDVPTGAGLSSSAALVCSVVTALDDHLRLGADADALLALSREVENEAVGAPTGGMDQLASLRSVAGHALFCDMRSLSAEPVPLDLDAAGLAIVVADTNAPHRHSDGEYADRRRGCERAADALGVAALRDVPLRELDAALGRLDSATLRRYTRHVVTENARVLDVVSLLRDGEVAAIGPHLTRSHVSMRDDFQITVPEVDAAVEALLDAGALGARMTGGGFGGCVIGLVDRDEVEPASRAVRTAFERAGYAAPTLFTASPREGARKLD